MSETKLDIRLATPADLGSALEVTLAAYQQFEDLMEARDWKLYRRHIEQTFIGISEVTHLLAADSGVASDRSLLGSVLLYPAGKADYKTKGAKSGSYPEIRLLAVAPAARGRGVGQALMDACLERSRASGAKQVGLHTMAPMDAARRMYSRMGFQPVPELDFQPFPKLAAEAFVMELS